MREINLTNFRRMLGDMQPILKDIGYDEVPDVLTQEIARDFMKKYRNYLCDNIMKDMKSLRDLGSAVFGRPIEVDSVEDSAFISLNIDNIITEINMRYHIYKQNDLFDGQDISNINLDNASEDSIEEDEALATIEFENIMSTNNCRQVEITRNGILVFATGIGGDTNNLALECEKILRDILPSNEKFTYGVDIEPESPSDAFYFTAPVIGVNNEVIKYVVRVAPKSTFFDCYESLETVKDDCETNIIIGRDFDDSLKVILVNIDKTKPISDKLMKLNSDGVIKEVLKVIRINPKTLGIISNITLRGDVECHMNLE